MAVGPVEYVIIGFPENNFDGSILPALKEIVDAGLVHILDAVFIAKGADGEILGFEYEDLPGLAETFAQIDGEAGGYLNDEDVALAAGSLEPDTSAVLLVWEDLWASAFADALAQNGGVLLAGGRIPRDIVQAAFDAAES